MLVKVIQSGWLRLPNWKKLHSMHLISRALRICWTKKELLIKKIMAHLNANVGRRKKNPNKKRKKINKKKKFTWKRQSISRWRRIKLSRIRRPIFSDCWFQAMMKYFNHIYIRLKIFKPWNKLREVWVNNLAHQKPWIKTTSFNSNNLINQIKQLDIKTQNCRCLPNRSNLNDWYLRFNLDSSPFLCMLCSTEEKSLIQFGSTWTNQIKFKEAFIQSVWTNGTNKDILH